MEQTIGFEAGQERTILVDQFHQSPIGDADAAQIEGPGAKLDGRFYRGRGRGASQRSDGGGSEEMTAGKAHKTSDSYYEPERVPRWRSGTGTARGKSRDWRFLMRIELQGTRGDQVGATRRVAEKNGV